MLIFAIAAIIQSVNVAEYPKPIDFFEGRIARRIVYSESSVSETEACMLASGISATSFRSAASRDQVIFFSTLATMSGRHPPIWRLSATSTGSQLEVFDMRAAIRRAKTCFNDF